MPRTITIIVSILFGLAFTEGLLRIQDQFFPIVKLSDLPEGRHKNQFSNLLHHRKGPSDGFVQRIQSGQDDCPSQEPAATVLFLGDSWMEWPPLPSAFAKYVKPRLGTCGCIEVLFAGTSSYSPSPIMLQGEHLAQKYDLDFLIINIEETDLMDEYLRYRKAAVRDADGNLIRVSPNTSEILWSYGHLASEEQPIYLLRFLELTYFKHVFMPRFRRVSSDDTDNLWYDKLMAPQLSSDPENTHADEIDHFTRSLHEMITRLAKAVGGREKILITHHPHVLHLETSKSGRQYNDIVSQTVSETAQKNAVLFYDAARDVAQMYGSDYRRYFRWPKDPFSHLTHDGLQRYGEFIGKAFLSRMRSALGREPCAGVNKAR